MLESLSPGAAPSAYLAFWILLLVSFLIGWVFSMWYHKTKYQEAIDDCQRQKQGVIMNHEKTIDELNNLTNQYIKNEALAVISAPKVEVTESKPEVNFARVGKFDESQKDDLKKIKGVGKFIEEKLYKIGIYTFTQIGNFTSEDVQTVTDLIEFFPGRIERDDWVGQAKMLDKEARSNRENN